MHPISQFLVNQFIKYLYSFWNRAKINSMPNFFNKFVHQGLRYGIYDGTLEGKKDKPKF